MYLSLFSLNLYKYVYISCRTKNYYIIINFALV